MGPQWRSRLDREASLLGTVVAVLAVTIWISHWRLKTYAVTGHGWRNRKRHRPADSAWWNAVAINDVPAQSDFYSSATVVCLTTWYAMPANRKKWPFTESLASAFKLSPGT